MKTSTEVKKTKEQYSAIARNIEQRFEILKSKYPEYQKGYLKPYFGGEPEVSLTYEFWGEPTDELEGWEELVYTAQSIVGEIGGMSDWCDDLVLTWPQAMDCDGELKRVVLLPGKLSVKGETRLSKYLMDAFVLVLLCLTYTPIKGAMG